MNAISKALQEVYFQIPSDVLNIAFNDNPIHNNVSLDEVMLSRVIRPKILVDCNLVGGIESIIDINRCNVYDYSTLEHYEYIIDVPKSLTGGKSIIAPINVMIRTARGNYGKNNNPITRELTSNLNAINPPSAISTARLELVGENQVMVMDPSVSFVSGVLKCVLENNSNLSNISPRSYIAFSKLVVLGIKAFIYNHLRVRVAKGYIYNGHELSVITDIVNEYSEASNDYSEYLTTTWAKVAYHSDSNRLANYITGSI